MEGYTLIKIFNMEWYNLKNCLNDYAEYLEMVTKDYMPAYYELKDKISFNVQINGVLFEIEFRAPEYWKWANYGRGPGKFPPSSAIDDWVTRRKIAPYPLKNRKTPTRPQLVYLISRKIAEKGFKGSGFLEKGLKQQEEYWEERIQEAIWDDIDAEMMTWLSPLNGSTII